MYCPGIEIDPKKKKKKLVDFKSLVPSHKASRVAEVWFSPILQGISKNLEPDIRKNYNSKLCYLKSVVWKNSFSHNLSHLKLECLNWPTLVYNWCEFIRIQY